LLTACKFPNTNRAKQHHPLLQTSLIESYYVSFYMSINIGALIGGVMVPVWAQHNVTEAYFIPLVVLTLGVLVFLLGGPRYVRSKPKTDFCSFFQSSPKKSSVYVTAASSDSIPLSTIFRISLLVVPFNIAYSQMATTFIVQGTVMRKAFGWIDAASMNNADAVAVLLFGYVVGTHMYPALADRGIKIPTTYKFAFGSALGALAIGWALIVEAMIHAKYEATGHKVGILWQVCRAL
jgi:dipeptide/tripeptide permease